MTHEPLIGHSKKKAAVEPGVKDSAVRCDRNLDWHLRRLVNGYFMVHSAENGVLWYTDMSMEQGWKMHFRVI